MTEKRTYEELKELLADYDLDLTLNEFRFYVEYDDHVTPWVFDNLDEVRAFADGIDYACEFVTA
jgi:hypothetical protein